MTKLDVWVAYANIKRFQSLIAVADTPARISEIQSLLEAEVRKVTGSDAAAHARSSQDTSPA